MSEEHDQQPAGDGISEDDRRRLDEARAELDNIYRLRGEIVSRVNELEAYIDVACARYFHLAPGDPLSGEFVSWVLGRLSLGAKVDILTAIMEKRGADALVKPVLAKIKWANNVRNNIAHSHVSFDIEDDATEVGLESLFRHRSIRVTRQGRSSVLTNTEELQRDRNAISDLEVHLFMLTTITMEPVEGTSFAQRLDEFYELNPEFKLTRPR